MSRLEELLSRALLVPDRFVPTDTIQPLNIDTARPPGGQAPSSAAVANLRALCETVVRYTPTTVVASFVTDQVPEPDSALVLACVLQLADRDEGARFWWQYAAGAGHTAAAYCLYLHHLALGETHAARWWHTQTNEEQVDSSNRDSPSATTVYWDDELVPPALRGGEGPTVTTLLRVVHRLARQSPRPHSSAVTELMTYMPIAVAIGYLREPDSELPLPGPNFARQIRARLSAGIPSDEPSHTQARLQHRPTRRRDATKAERNCHCQADEAASY